MNKQEFEGLLETLKSKVKEFEGKYNLNVCQCFLDREEDNLPVEKYVVNPASYKHRNFYVFYNEFFNIYVDGWYHNYSGWTEVPRGFKSGLTKLIKNYCEKNGLYCELRKAYRATITSMANTCAFLIAINK